MVIGRCGDIGRCGRVVEHICGVGDDGLIVDGHGVVVVVVSPVVLVVVAFGSLGGGRRSAVGGDGGRHRSAVGRWGDGVGFGWGGGWAVFWSIYPPIKKPSLADRCNIINQTQSRRFIAGQTLFTAMFGWVQAGH